MFAEQRDRFGVHFVDASSSGFAVTYQMRVLQHPQMLRDRGPAHGQLLRKLAHRQRPPRQALQDDQPRWITQCLEPSLYVSLHER